MTVLSLRAFLSLSKIYPEKDYRADKCNAPARSPSKKKKEKRKDTGIPAAVHHIFRLTGPFGIPTEIPSALSAIINSQRLVEFLIVHLPAFSIGIFANFPDNLLQFQ
jgi:hypothetical protein